MPDTTRHNAPLVLASVQLKRNTPAEVVQAKAPWREAMLEGFRRRNAVLDGIFYDIGAVTPLEAGMVAPWLAREGTLLIVPPSGAGSLQLCSTVPGFLAAGGDGTRILTVAGAGSSALGTAAFARNVADAFGEPVAALVSGYGLADPGTHFSLLVGHSNGNLVISEALYALRDDGADAALDDIAIVTMSAAIAMPPRYRRIIDVMGELDWLGMMNSNCAIPVEYHAKNAWHHTNTELSWHLPVREVLCELRRTQGAALAH